VWCRYIYISRRTDNGKTRRECMYSPCCSSAQITRSYSQRPITNSSKLFYHAPPHAGTFNRILIPLTPSYSTPQDTRSKKCFVAFKFYIRTVVGRGVHIRTDETLRMRPQIWETRLTRLCSVCRYCKGPA
jgi:hypothetical protein